jgi:hypothetical protein
MGGRAAEVSKHMSGGEDRAMAGQSDSMLGEGSTRKTLRQEELLCSRPIWPGSQWQRR